MRFLLIDDHGLVRAALKAVLQHEFSSAEVIEASDAASAMKLLPSKAWDLILLDIDLPDRSGLDLIRDIKSVSGGSRILVLSGHAEKEVGARVLKTGAHGFVCKASPTAELVGAVRRVLSGKKYLSPDLAANILDIAMGESEAPHDALSDRELEVLKQFGRGLTASQISDSLGLSIKTVSTYRARILVKLGLETTGDLVRYAVKNNLA